MTHHTVEDRLSIAMASVSFLVQPTNLGTFLDCWDAIRPISGIPNLWKTFLAMSYFSDQSAITAQWEDPSTKMLPSEVNQTGSMLTLRLCWEQGLYGQLAKCLAP